MPLTKGRYVSIPVTMQDFEPKYEANSDGLKAADKKPLDLVSIGLSVAAVILIIIGVFFINQSFKTTNDQVASSSSSSSKSSSSVSTRSSSSISSSVSSSVVSSVSVASVISSSVSSVSSSQVLAFDAVNAPLKTGATNAEIKLKITDVSDVVGGSVVDTGFQNTRWFAKPGIVWGAFELAKFTPAPVVGDIYRVELQITADQSNGAIAEPGAIVILKTYKL